MQQHYINRGTPTVICVAAQILRLKGIHVHAAPTCTVLAYEYLRHLAVAWHAYLGTDGRTAGQ